MLSVSIWSYKELEIKESLKPKANIFSTSSSFRKEERRNATTAYE
jgi:hypothetical protein